MSRRKSPHYPGEIEYRSIDIPNASREQMREVANKLPFRGYHVETLDDGRKICITKPGGKQFYGLQPNDFMVWIYDEARHDRWRISHEEILNDLKAKLASNPMLCGIFIDRLLDVCNGAEPNDIRKNWPAGLFSGLPGLPAELILKSYKWIWVQEDCNYPTAQGRWKSMNPIIELRKSIRNETGAS
jgi:hypothetical protein